MQQRRSLVLDRHTDTPKKQIHFASQYCTNLRTVDIRNYTANVSDLIELIQHAPFIEVFLSKTSNTPIVKALREHCPNLTALSLSCNNLDVSKLAKFQSLRALEIGSHNSLLSIDASEIVSILHKNRNLELLHVLYYANSFTLINALDATKIRSLSFPYEQYAITTTKVDMLRSFTRLENVNFGQSDIAGVDVLFALAKDHPNLLALSFKGSHTIRVEFAAALAKNDILPHLQYLGCRNKDDVYKEVQERRTIQIFDYELPRDKPHLWCHDPFDIRTLSKLYTFVPDT